MKLWPGKVGEKIRERLASGEAIPGESVPLKSLRTQMVVRLPSDLEPTQGTTLPETVRAALRTLV